MKTNITTFATITTLLIFLDEQLFLKDHVYHLQFNFGILYQLV